MRFSDSNTVAALSARRGVPALHWNPFSAVKDAAVNVGHAVGGVLDNKYAKGALAAGLAATGVGAPLAAGIMAGTGALGGALHEGGGLRDAIGGGVSGAAEGYGASKLGGVLHSGGSVLSKAGALGGLLKDGAGAIPGAGAIGSGLSSLGGGSPLAGLLTAAQTANAAQLGQKSNEYADKAFNFANDSYQARAPLRTQGINSLMNPTTRDTSNLTAIRSQNPRSGLSPLQPPRMA